MNIKVPEILYHYCSVEAFFAILHNKSVWLCDAGHLNDYKEIRWSRELIQETLSKYSDSDNQLRINQLSEAYGINVLHPFIFCLSESPDILSQWRAYASDGAGVAIGFNSKIFDTATRLPSIHFAPKSEIAVWKVIYERPDQELLIREVIEAYLAICKKWFSGDPPNATINASYQLTGISTFLKNPAFSEEKEWRLIHTPLFMTDGGNANHLSGTHLTCKQRVKESDIYTYFEHPVLDNQDGISPISEIWIGPTCALSEFDLELFFSLNGYGKVKINRSKASYRRRS